MTTVKQEKTLLDEFAMAALNGIMASRPPDRCYSPHEVAEFACQIADAMMKERQKYETN